MKTGSGGAIGVGGVIDVSGSGSTSLSLKSLKGLLGIVGGVVLSEVLLKVGSTSGVSSNSGSGGVVGVGGITGGRFGGVEDPRGSWLFVEEGGLGKLPKSSFAMLNLVWQILMSVSRNFY